MVAMPPSEVFFAEVIVVKKQNIPVAHADIRINKRYADISKIIRSQYLKIGYPDKSVGLAEDIHIILFSFQWGKKKRKPTEDSRDLRF